ncbi:acyl-CoA dehydrogenase family protein [Sulfitobacter sp. F26169L]|uniref:acyl-CoA dehydrogenase family protein n=1 Tax=Sulfitobacter sp. F26169L TaxID=2996015 RepID=UPI002260D8B4|nr:acyl-CoA dehydrogenase family protein [Sulfitobacter sp. F26169L]MCX7567961.1 acyl-CoA dehydrogenase family protein [Sulfitobacter sp. F26169L]
MNLDYNAEELDFRAEVRTFIEENLPSDIQAKVLAHKRLNRDDYKRWHQILHAKGWVAPAWPVETGGAGWNPVQRHIWEEEATRAGAPNVLSFGVNMIGPVLMAFGSDEQKSHYLPRILSCEDWWCQGYSEPGSGSDLASLKTAAKRVQEDDGEYYVVNGQKTWTTLGQHADMIFCLVRTDNSGRKQQGISFLLIDMNTPGITVRPIITLDEDHEVNEIFFDNVKVPVKNLVGQENMGWTYAKYLLSHERNNVAEVGRSKRELRYLKQLAMAYTSDGKPLLEDPLFARKVAILEAELMALEITNLRVVSADDGKSEPGPEVSMLKIVGTEVQQRLTELMVQAVGPYGLPFDAEFLEGETEHAVTGKDDAAPLTAAYLNFRKASIYGGSNEIQKNIMNKMILGL